MEEFPISEFRYLIGTGKYWKGSIGKGRVVFDHSALATSLFVFKQAIYLRKYDFGPLQYRPNLDVTYSEDFTVIEFTNYKPIINETIDIAFVSFWSNYIYPSETYLWDLEVYLEELSNEKLYLMQNEILARRGHKFSDPELSVYFKTKSWYKPTTVTSLNELTEAEKYL
ncbi:MAG: YARHG domain-containing protein [Calditrichota bacterium]